jgi:hypothetical protein
MRKNNTPEPRDGQGQKGSFTLELTLAEATKLGTWLVSGAGRDGLCGDLLPKVLCAINDFAIDRLTEAKRMPD